MLVKTTKYIDYWCKLLLAHREDYQITQYFSSMYTQDVYET
jgi:hypothetical protein